jgi:hypothetical protein
MTMLTSLGLFGEVIGTLLPKKSMRQCYASQEPMLLRVALYAGWLYGLREVLGDQRTNSR